MIFHIFHRKAVQLIHCLDEIELLVIVRVQIPRLMSQPDKQACRDIRMTSVFLHQRGGLFLFFLFGTQRFRILVIFAALNLAINPGNHLAEIDRGYIQHRMIAKHLQQLFEKNLRMRLKS